MTYQRMCVHIIFSSVSVSVAEWHRKLLYYFDWGFKGIFNQSHKMDFYKFVSCISLG